MKAVTRTELGAGGSRVIDEVLRSGEPVVVTADGKPVAVVSPVDEETLHDYALSYGREYVDDRADAEARYARGERDSRPLSEVLADLESDTDGDGRANG